MKEDELRWRTARRLADRGVRPLGDTLWDRAYDARDVEALEEEGKQPEEIVEALVANAFDLYSVAKQVSIEQRWVRFAESFEESMETGSAGPRAILPRGVSESLDNFELSAYETERALAFSWLLARSAEHDVHHIDGLPEEEQEKQTPVQRFRSQYLGGVLTPIEAASFLESPAIRFIPRRDLEELGVPIHEHRSQVRSYSRSRVDGRIKWEVVVFIDPPGIELSSTRHTKPGQPLPKLWLQDVGIVQPLTYVSYSVMDELTKLRDHLCRHYPWREADTVWFILTGRPPWVPPITATWERQGLGFPYDRATVTFTIEPWVPSETVVKLYRTYQRDLLTPSGGRIRPIGRDVSLVRHWQRVEEEKGREATWEEIAAAWPRASSYRVRRNMATKCQAAVQAILRPRYETPRRRHRTADNIITDE